MSTTLVSEERIAKMVRMAKEVGRAQLSIDKARFLSVELGWEGLQVPKSLKECSDELTYVISQLNKALTPL